MFGLGPLGKFLGAAASGPLRLAAYLYEERDRLSWDKFAFLLFSGILVYFVVTTAVHQSFLLYREVLHEREEQDFNEKLAAQCRGLAGGPLLYAKGTKGDCERASYVMQTLPIVRAFDTVTGQWPTPHTFLVSMLGFGGGSGSGGWTIESRLLHYSLLGWLGMAAWYLLVKPARRVARDRDIKKRENALREYQFMHLFQRFYAQQRLGDGEKVPPIPTTEKATPLGPRNVAMRRPLD